MKTFTTASLLTFLALTTSTTSAQSTTAAPSQSSAVAAALSSYSSSLLHGPVATSIGLAVELEGSIPPTALASVVSGVPSLIPTPTSNGDLFSFATQPPVTFQEPAWVTMYLPSAVQEEVKSLQTSIVLAEASIVRSVLGVTVTPAVELAAASSGSATGSAASASSTGAKTNAAAGSMTRPDAGMVAAALGVVAVGVAALL